MDTEGLAESEIKQLIEIAKEARERAMVYKSKVAWGASVLAEDGQTFGGCNIDGIISDEGLCAERVAINHAVAHGRYHYKAICLFGQELGVPCGRCLQYALLFCQVKDADIAVLMVQGDGGYEISSIRKLLPRGYETRIFREELLRYKDKLKMENGSDN